VLFHLVCTALQSNYVCVCVFGRLVVAVCLSQAELSALASAARLASLQAGRLEALDSEVVKLQRLLALVGKHIKAGAQQQQVGRRSVSELARKCSCHAGESHKAVSAVARTAYAALLDCVLRPCLCVVLAAV
jgi:hypothetical protein